ncbi:MBL fold metallo-hydrolase [Paenibacillus filicis]|uniref:MBL fold metallo-hydrolase n=2 Tax=Paenibacillus filicis TaxID=669464 RepID=A0ABU9DJQ4_9BACL
MISAAAVAVLIYAGLRTYPVLGGRAPAERRQLLRQSENYREGKFMNQIPTVMEKSLKENAKMMADFIKGNPRGRPEQPLAVETYRPALPNLGRSIVADGSTTEGASPRVTWFGHSAVLIELEGKTLFCDPMLGRTPSPFPLFGGKRYGSRLPAEIEDLPPIDVVLLSHDHYDHLDYGSIRKLKDKVQRFFVPLGVGAHLIRWGVSAEKIEEHDWWEETAYLGLTLACTPARHFSGRSLSDRDATLWCSWVIRGQESSIFFSGDSGYGPHFAEIGRAYGPFDLTLMECGQYDPRWAVIHMLPEETVQAHQEVRGKALLPIHWGAFTLALHDWTDPVERLAEAARSRDVALCTPRIGETVHIGSSVLPSSPWWRSVTTAK